MTTDNGHLKDYENDDLAMMDEDTPPHASLEEEAPPDDEFVRFSWLDGELRSIKDRSGGSWLKEPPPPREYLLESEDGRGLLVAGRVAFIAAAGGVGKSMALCQLALAVAAGGERQTKWLGTYPVRKGGRVLLVMGEEEDDEIRRRLFYSARTMGMDNSLLDVAAANIVPMGLSGRDDVAMTKMLAAGAEGSTATDFALTFLEKLKATAGEAGWTCIIFDPLSRFAGGDVEKDNAAATRMVQVLERFTKLPGNPAVMVAHHTRKLGSTEDTNTDADDMRGASGLKDGARWVGVLENVAVQDERLVRIARFKVGKSNYGVFPGSLLLARDRDNEGALRPATEKERENVASRSKQSEKKKDAHIPTESHVDAILENAERKAKEKSEGDLLKEEGM